ncbi:sensor histidine kinase [Atopobium fossor]|uniref:sensor histidine kinase n=1 Tax=Atopobium fossor TaxID=39487 RepID=UPI000684BEC4|nr:HAMP domain-containing sensor histidine kinase [Atopobium fossor]
MAKDPIQMQRHSLFTKLTERFSPHAGSGLGWRLVGYATIALLFGIVTYVVVYALASHAFDAYFSRECVYCQRLESDAQTLQSYVNEKNISVSDKKALDAWVEDAGYVALQIYRDGMTLYDSSMSTDISSLNISSGDMAKWQRSYPIVFADGEASAVFFDNIGAQGRFVATIISIVLGFVVCIITLLVLMRRIVRYIRLLDYELSLLEGGELDHAISVKGNDELGSLAQSIDDMRLAIRQRFVEEERLRNREYKLVTEMSHDLRSPLTALIGYLDILSLGKCTNKQDAQRYLQSSREKAYQIKELSDDLFDYVLKQHIGDMDSSCSAQVPIEKNQTEQQSCYEFLPKVLDEGILELTSAGFQIEYKELPVTCTKGVHVNQRILRRAFSNLFSNVIQHANRTAPVCIQCSCLETAAVVSITNTPAPEIENTAGTGLGVATAMQLFSSCGWELVVSQDVEHYSAIVTIPFTAVV